jgi:hypothetical protein
VKVQQCRNDAGKLSKTYSRLASRLLPLGISFSHIEDGWKLNERTPPDSVWLVVFATRNLFHFPKLVVPIDQERNSDFVFAPKFLELKEGTERGMPP